MGNCKVTPYFISWFTYHCTLVKVL